ncbi:hypothetical protein A0U91_09890 [Acetobacter persici]|uniref:Uncharacterized protein n=1 Tax=Acetobacter persici TaxID=1076596 RepID=A0A1U9LFB0_9PROT|nr:hypothetical protein A0U91_09890 [Acetobacter persici]
MFLVGTLQEEWKFALTDRALLPRPVRISRLPVYSDSADALFHFTHPAGHDKSQLFHEQGTIRKTCPQSRFVFLSGNII